mmetsp:Transcript_56051/g.156167  ORF Transcript_56051/g.156167 Transcript_56051/m.156167 type:complete len:390 (+) Transcript_56051:264-1433(+)
MAARALPRGLPVDLPRIKELAKKQAATITLGQLMRSSSSDLQSRVRQARWLQETIPIRFARRIDDFMQLPYVAVQHKLFRGVMDLYLETLNAVWDIPTVATSENETAFRELMARLLGKHSSVVPDIAEGYWEVRQMYPDIRLDGFLDNLFTTRISSRILVENYIGMGTPDYSGVVQRDLSPLNIIRDHAAHLTKLVHSIYGVAPRVEFTGNLGCTVDYIPRHVTFMIQEVLKNALRATVERHQGNSRTLSLGIPPVVIELQKGDVYMIIKISDQGGGLPKHLQNEAWKYGWSTVSEEEHVTLDPATWPGSPLAQRRRELAGYGFGLPLTRLYAQYFGGELFMQVLPGHGTSMYILLNHLKEGTPSTEMDDPATALTTNENSGHSINSAP